MKQDDIDNAINSFAKALELDEELHFIRYDYANLLVSKNKTTQALEQYEIFIENLTVLKEKKMYILSLTNFTFKRIICNVLITYAAISIADLLL